MNKMTNSQIEAQATAEIAAMRLQIINKMVAVSTSNYRAAEIEDRIAELRDREQLLLSEIVDRMQRAMSIGNAS